MSDKQRFDLKDYPLPRSAQGKTFFDKAPGYKRLQRNFQQLIDDPGLGVLTAEAGVGKTAAIRNLCQQLPRPDYRVLYTCDTTVAPVDVYRGLAADLGVRPSHRRSQLWRDLKKALEHAVDEQSIQPLLVMDEAQHLSDAFLHDLSGFLNFAFDSRDLLTVWLVGLPPLSARLRMHQHAALFTRIAVEVRLEPLEREPFAAAVQHAFAAQGAKDNVLSDPAMELLFRSSRGVLRLASRLLRVSLRLASDRGQAFLDETIVEQALDESGLS